jgi:hypothetical protein
MNLKKIVLILTFLLLVLSLAGCSRKSLDLSVYGDGRHYIKFDDIEYGKLFLPTPLLSSEHHMTLFDTVKRKDKNVYRNGDADGLEAGTPVYTLDDYAPTFRLVVKQGQELVIYQVNRNPKATKGGDVLDIERKVIRIGIQDPDKYTEIASITDQNKIDQLVQMILEAPYSYTVITNEGTKMISLDFYLSDGTKIREFLWLDSGVMGSNIQLPEEFCTSIWELLVEKQKSTY